ncbi:MAG: nitronate monooxygenase [Kosmotogaceae bacterium]
MIIKTRLTEMLDINIPIIEGGMAWVGTPKLAASISECGALGTIGTGNFSPDEAREKIKELRKLTDKTFAVNLIILNPYLEELIDVVIDEKVPVVIFGAGNPGRYIKKLKDNNIKVFAVVSSDSLAKRCENNGADAIIGEGMECGGHIGDVSTLVLIQKLLKVINIPVIAAGGIASGEAIAGMLTMGAEGVQLGTAFVATKECEAHERYKQKIVKSGIRGTAITGEKLGHPVRVLKSGFTRKVREAELSSQKEAEELLINSLERAYRNGNTDGSFMAGQSAGLINEVKTVSELLNTLMEEAECSLRRITSMFGANNTE